MTATAVDGGRRRSRGRRVGPVLAGVVVTVVAVAPVLAPNRPDHGVGAPFERPSPGLPLGTDAVGRDVWSQVLSGGIGVVMVAAVIALVVTALASVVGIVAALVRAERDGREGPLGLVLEGAIDLALLVPPVLGMLLVLLSWPDGGVFALGGVAVLFGTPYCARVVKAAAAGVAASGYVEVARAGGDSLWTVARHEVLPNLRDTLLTQLGLRFSESMYLVATAAFLRLPAGVGEHNWAVMVRDNAAGVLLTPWATVVPALCVVAVSVTVQWALDRTGTAGRSW